MIRLGVDLTNPGQFFGCCGVFELAQRLWGGVTACFENAHFVVSDGDLDELVAQTVQAPLQVLEPVNQTSSALRLAGPFNLRIDWWKSERGLKTWAGRMSVDRIAMSLQRDLPNTSSNRFFNDGHVIIGADHKKVEPYYFDGRRGATALPLDVGFSSDALSLETVAGQRQLFLSSRCLNAECYQVRRLKRPAIPSRYCCQRRLKIDPFSAQTVGQNLTPQCYSDL